MSATQKIDIYHKKHKRNIISFMLAYSGKEFKSLKEEN